MVSKKDFKAVAEIIRKADKSGELKYAGSVAYRFSKYFATQNPHFDRERFMKACGLD